MGMPRRPSMRFLLPRPAHVIALGLGAGHNDARWLRKRERENQLLAEVRRHAAQRFRGTNSPPPFVAFGASVHLPEAADFRGHPSLRRQAWSL